MASITAILRRESSSGTAGILDRDSHGGLRGVLAGALHGGNHTARVGELDGAADEVDEYLTDSAGIPDKVTRHAGRVLQDQVQLAVFGPGSQQLIDFFDQQAEVEKRGLDRQHARLDFGEIQDVVN